MLTEEELTERTLEFVAERLRGDRAGETLSWLREIAKEVQQVGPSDEIIDGVARRCCITDVTAFCPWAEKAATVCLEFRCEIEEAELLSDGYIGFSGRIPERCKKCRFRKDGPWEARLSVWEECSAGRWKKRVEAAWTALSGEAVFLAESVMLLQMTNKG